MKKFLMLAAVLAGFAMSAFAQTAVPVLTWNGEPTMLTMPEHTHHASQTPMAEEKSILEHSDSVAAHGERPLWEVMQAAPFVCLGDAARDFKQEHATSRKASVVWVNY